MSVKDSLFQTAFTVIRTSGADRWLAPITRGAGLVLMFHHVRPWRPRAFAPNRLLEITPDFLDTTLRVISEMGFDPIAIDDLPARLVEPRARPFAVLTFDDGYRDNRDHALPVLRRHAAPWTLFVTTDYADGRGQLWWIELEEAIRRSESIVLSTGGGEQRLSCATAAEKNAAFAKAYWALRAEPEPALRAAIAAMAGKAGIDGAALVREHCLDWDELRALGGEARLNIGAHTLSHPMLAKHGDEIARREIVDSKTRIEAELGKPVRHFAYPVGDPTSAGPRDFRIVRDAGFATGVTTRRGHVFPEHAAHLEALPRVSINGRFQNEAALRALLSGVAFFALNRGRRLDVA